MQHLARMTVLAVLAVATPLTSAAKEEGAGKGTSAVNTKYLVESAEFKSGAPLPKSATCDGEGKSPALSWSADKDDRAKSFALIVEDPDAPKGTFTHWVLFNIPSITHALPHDASGIGISGRNDFDKNGYGAACPPKGHGTHRYYFRIYALDVEKLALAEGAKRSDVEAAMQSHVIGEGELMGKYIRR